MIGTAAVLIGGQPGLRPDRSCGFVQTEDLGVAPAVLVFGDHLAVDEDAAPEGVGIALCDNVCQHPGIGVVDHGRSVNPTWVLPLSSR